MLVTLFFVILWQYQTITQLSFVTRIIASFHPANTKFSMKKNDIPKWAKWKNRAYMPNYFVLDSDVEENIRVAEWGDAWAQGMLVERYLQGRGVEQSYEKYFEWLTKAAEQGEPVSQYNLGRCYENGIGVAKDLYKALEWYKKAAEEGDKDAKKAVTNWSKSFTTHIKNSAHAKSHYFCIKTWISARPRYPTRLSVKKIIWRGLNTSMKETAYMRKARSSPQ